MRQLHQHFNVRNTPQTEPMPGRSDMTQNAAGGYGWELDKWGKLDRFLVLGTEGGTYYVGEKELTKENANSVIECIKEDGRRVVNGIVEVSEGGKAAKNDYALFALALATAFGDEDTKRASYDSLPKVARIGTHLFTFLNYVQSMRGWSRGLRSAVARWYNDKPPKDLAYQLTKYQQRYGFSHRDALRLSHPKPPTMSHAELYSWATQGFVGTEIMDEETLNYLSVAHYMLKGNPSEAEAIEGIEKYRLPREVVPTELLKTPGVWKALLGDDGGRMPMTALVRNLGNLTKLGVLKPMSDLTEAVATRLADKEAIRRARVHPFSVLTAMLTYRSGGGFRGSGEWTPINRIVEALEAAFYNAFENAEPTNKRILYAVDVSGSMTGGYFGGGNVAGVPGLSPAMAAGAMALVCAATEPRYAIWGFDHNLYQLPITARSTLSEAMSAASMHGGMTDASLPFRGALQEGIEVDAFVLLTDSETWSGPRHPVQALAEYRRQTGLPSKLVVVGMTAGRSTIGDPRDAGILDVVGLATDTSRLIGDFIRG